MPSGIYERTEETKRKMGRTKKGKNNPSYKHGEAGKTQLYAVWKNMKNRCCNSKIRGYSRYGGRGISVCLEWINNFITFRDFALSHGYKEGLTIDRIDNDGNYEPLNCQFITRAENSKKYHKFDKNKKDQK